MNYERLEKCPLCSGTSFRNHLIAIDHFLTHESFAIVECDTCHLKFTNPRPSISDIPRFYKSEDYISHTDSGGSFLINIAYKIVRKFTLRRKVAILNRAAKSTKKSVLDYGCGTGHFLSACANNGWEATGVEPDQNAAAQARSKGLQIFSRLEDVPDSTFTIITLWHVLEHIHDVNGLLENLKKRLRKTGTLLIAAPNCSSYDAQVFKEYWAGYDVPRHLYHFELETLKKLLGKHGFKIEAIIPQKFDAFYVSILSNKYKNNALKILNSINIGIKSNKDAEKNEL